MLRYRAIGSLDTEVKSESLAVLLRNLGMLEAGRLRFLIFLPLTLVVTKCVFSFLSLSFAIIYKRGILFSTTNILFYEMEPAL